MKKIIFSLLGVLPFVVQAQDKFEITGKLPAAGSDRIVVLSYKNSQDKTKSDTATIKDGTFSFMGETAFGNKSKLSLLPGKSAGVNRRRQPDEQTFYLEKGKYNVVGTDSLSTAKITGAQAQTDYLAYLAQTGKLTAQYNEITERFMKVYRTNDTAAIKKIQTEAKPVHAQLEAAKDAFIMNHPDSYVSLDVLASSEKAALIDPKVFDPLYKPLTKRVLASFTGQKLVANYETAVRLAVGQTVDFTESDDKGNPFKLSSLRGKYVLVDFWASWCAPCRAENPNLLKAYQKLKDKNFDIVGVSLDEGDVEWLKAVDQDGMPWTQVRNIRGSNNDIQARFGINAIPQNALLDPNGVVIARNLRGEELQQKLSEILSKH